VLFDIILFGNMKCICFSLKGYMFFISVLFSVADINAQYVLQGLVTDKNSNETLIGASVIIKGTTNGATTDINGKFEISIPTPPPVTLVISFMGYVSQEIEVKSLTEKIKVHLGTDEVLLNTVEIVGQRISDKQKESPLTIEAMDIIAIKETPAANFYEGLGQLKGVDLTSASIGFKIINTRGFNSTSPVRSLQIIDGVDNQAPGLNFSLGNFLGASELDVMKVDLVVGASSAFYGPNAFNGVISMNTKNPFLFQGVSAMVKVGERSLLESAVRYAQAFKNKKGEEKFAYKLNIFWMQADDWEATNDNPSSQSEYGKRNPGGYDAVNRYGDENLSAGMNNATDAGGRVTSPGLGRWYRTGYWEKDLVSYDSKNLKAGTALHYKFKPETELIYASNFGTGTTVYQGDNRYSLKDILFFQNRLEFKKTDKYFIRAYATNENAGNSYDAVFTAFLLQNASKDNNTWSKDYRNYWNSNIVKKVKKLPGFQDYVFGQPYPYEHNDSVMYSHYDSLVYWHNLARSFADSNPTAFSRPFFQPGTPEFDSLLASITSKKSYGEGGTKFYDKSALYHVHGEYKFQPVFADIVVGGNLRLYKPVSAGTIFSDTGSVVIVNREFGVYTGIEKKFIDERLKINISSRVDKNQNFNPVISPAASAVYIANANHTLRLSLSSALRNPTLADQYLHYNVGRAILLGNISGYDSLVTTESLTDFINTQNRDTLVYINLSPIKPERVKTIELGYRATLFNNLFLDAGYYYSFYSDFIGYRLLANAKIDTTVNRPTSIQVFRIASNAETTVTTQGFSIGFNYFFRKYYSLSGNYSWNVLNKTETSDPLIPAFNTPANKFNIGVSGRDVMFNINWLKLFSDSMPTIKIRNFGFNVNYKWIEGFYYEGSPQFTGKVPTYDMLDAQINYRLPKISCTFKLGASNLLGITPFLNTIDSNGDEISLGKRFNNAFNNNNLQVYGGPHVGRLIYFSILFEPDKKR
jgi:iron complex outermembrane recepter protein